MPNAFHDGRNPSAQASDEARQFRGAAGAADARSL